MTFNLTRLAPPAGILSMNGAQPGDVNGAVNGAQDGDVKSGMNGAVNGAVNGQVAPSILAAQRPVIALVEFSQQVRYLCTVI